jgi:hypothetical protein
MIPNRLGQGVLLAVLTSVAWAVPVPAQEAAPLRGQMFLAGKTPIDPPPDEP